MPFLTIEFLFLDVLNFLKGHLPVMGHQQITIFLVLVCPFNSLVCGLYYLLQAMVFLLQSFQRLHNMAQRLILFIESLDCGFAS